MRPSFEANRTSWQIHVTREEIRRVGFALGSFGRPADDDAVAWVTKVSPRRRLWVIREGGTLYWLSADAAETDPAFALPLPDFLVSQLFELCYMNVMIEDDDDVDGVDIFANEVDNVLVARQGERYISVDHPNNPAFTPHHIPYAVPEHEHGPHHVLATVDSDDFRMFVDACTNIPRGVEIDVYPHVQMHIGDGAVASTLDWRRFGHQRLTVSVPAVTSGEGTASFHPWCPAHLLVRIRPDEDVQVLVDGPDAEYVYFVCGEWGVRVENVREEVARIVPGLIGALFRAGCPTPDDAEHPIPSVVDFILDETHECSALVVPSDPPGTETIRLACVVATNVDPTGETLREINSLNAVLAGCRVIMRERRVMVTVDFPAADIVHLDHRVDDLRRGLQAASGLDVFLPLFSA